MSWLADTLLVTAGLILAILLVRRPVAYMFGPATAYALWAVPLVRLILPPLAIPMPAAASGPAPVVAAVASGGLAPLPAVEPDVLPFPLEPVLWSVWLTGVVVFLAWRVWGYLAMRRLLLAEAIGVGQAGTVRLVETPATEAPVAFGLFDKVVALPPGFMVGTDQLSRDLAIAHELEHHAARDLAVNIAMQPLFAAHWFNPLAWLGWRALRRDQEAACDARVVSTATADQRAIYGRLIASFAQFPRLALAASMACPVLGEASVINRLRSLTMPDKSPRRRIAGHGLIAAAVLALPLTATMSYAAAQDLPQQPVAPEAPAAVGPNQIVIIEKHSSRTDNAGLHTRVVQRNGRTIVLKTDSQLTDAEVEQKIAQALRTEAETPEPPLPPATPMPFAAAQEPAAPQTPEMPGKVQRRMIIMRGVGDQSQVQGRLDARRIDCHSGTAVSKVERKGDGQAMALVVCADQIEAQALAQASRSLAEARQRVAQDSKLSEELRRDILKDLDREIARLSTAG